MKTHQNHRKLGVTLAILAATVMAGPVPAQKQKKGVPAAPPQLIWPLPPEKPRIKFIAAIYGAADVEPAKKTNFLDRLAGIEKKDIKPGFVKPYGVATDSQGRIYVT